MIFKKLPAGVSIFNVVVIYCFMLDGKLPIFQKKTDHPCYPGLWGFTAGKVKPGENFLQASLREVWEETGNKKEEDCIISLGLSYPTRHQNLVTKEMFYFIAHMMFCAEPLSKIRIDEREHKQYHLATEKDIRTNKFNFIPDALENFYDSIKFIRQKVEN